MIVAVVGALGLLLLVILVAWQRYIIRGKNRQLELLALNEKLARQANEDELTQLPNRRAITLRAEHYLAMAQRQKQSFCVAVLDLDHFKQINDVYGHEAGKCFCSRV